MNHILNAILIIRYLIGAIGIIVFGMLLIISNAFDTPWMHVLSDFTLEKTAELYSAAVTIIATFLSIGLPLSISIISDHLKSFNNIEIMNRFIKEPSFIAMLLFLIPVLVILIFIAYGIKSKLAVLTTFILTGVFLFAFYKFMMRMVQYAIAPDKEFENHLFQRLDDYLNE